MRSMRHPLGVADGDRADGCQPLYILKVVFGIADDFAGTVGHRQPGDHELRPVDDVVGGEHPPVFGVDQHAGAE